MFDFFYNFHKKPLGYNLFSRDGEDGTPSPPNSVERITDNGITRITDNDFIRITDSTE